MTIVGFVLITVGLVAAAWLANRLATVTSPYRCRVTGRVHDYHTRDGGDGIPTHFYTYTCSFCGERFEI